MGKGRHEPFYVGVVIPLFQYSTIPLFPSTVPFHHSIPPNKDTPYRDGIADQTRTLYAIVGIVPSADFWMGRSFPSPATKNGAFGDDCWVMLEGG